MPQNQLSLSTTRVNSKNESKHNLTFYADKQCPVALYVRERTLPALVQAWVILGALYEAHGNDWKQVVQSSYLRR